MNKDARDHGEEIKGRIPAGRIGEPEDMAAAAIYLASRAGDYVVGSTLVVDGASRTRDSRERYHFGTGCSLSCRRKSS